jgi:hypothetical protein
MEVSQVLRSQITFRFGLLSMILFVLAEPAWAQAFSAGAPIPVRPASRSWAMAASDGRPIHGRGLAPKGGMGRKAQSNVQTTRRPGSCHV